MTDTTQFLIDHGPPILFVVVFLEQMGLPLPALPWLLAAGALSAMAKFNPLLGIGVTMLACLAADAFWFYLGRYRGTQVLNFLCRISLEPASCVRRTQNVFTRYGLRGVIVAKFLPGLNTVTPPLAGMSGMSAGRFLLADGFGALLYGGAFLCLGYCFNRQIQQLGAALATVGGGALGLLVGFVASYIGFKYWQRQRVLCELRVARITADELRGKLETGENLFILDLRSTAELKQDPSLIRGAVHLGGDDVASRHLEIPRDRDVIVYCSCPNEVTSARLALRLRRKGISRVWPLLGGIAAWREQNYPTELRTLVETRHVTGDLARSEPKLSEEPRTDLCNGLTSIWQRFEMKNGTSRRRTLPPNSHGPVSLHAPAGSWSREHKTRVLYTLLE